MIKISARPCTGTAFIAVMNQIALTLCGMTAICLLPGCTEQTDQQSSGPPKQDTSFAQASGQIPATEEQSLASAGNRHQAHCFFSMFDQPNSPSFQYHNGEEAGNFSILESLGGGLAAIDIDADGYDDICIAGGGGFADNNTTYPLANGLFRNQRGTSFSDISEPSGCDINLYFSHGIATTDFDCDGLADFVVTGYGGVQLFHNLGDGTFDAIHADQSGVHDGIWSSSAAWGDVNADGLPDLFVAHYVDWSFENNPFCNGPQANQREICPPRSFTGLSDSLFMNQGDGEFSDMSLDAGLLIGGKGLGVVMTDLDGDGDNDVYVTNDTVPNHLYQNDGQGKFSDVSLLSGTALSDRGVPDGSMGVDVCDFNNDGLADIWVVNYESETSALYQSSGNMVFRHVSQRAGINSVGGLYVGWGTCCQDFDLDGDEDMFVSNGHVIRYPVNAPLKQRPLLFLNTGVDKSGNVRFANASDAAGDYFQESHMGRGAAASDLDNDGDVDLAVSRINEHIAVLQNESDADANWIQFQCIGTITARHPVGTRIVVRTKSGQQARFVKSGGSYASGNSNRLFLGLADDSAIDAVDIYWPSGKHDTISSPALRTLHIVTQRAGSSPSIHNAVY